MRLIVARSKNEASKNLCALQRDEKLPDPRPDLLKKTN